ncbi:MAG: phospho-sugar mutase [Myxococcota bacterium]|nr:phospho-sugar mutase [Myxococcota bacterium]
MHAASQELKRLASTPEQAEQAIVNIERWLRGEEFSTYQPLLCSLIEQEAWDTLLDSFYRVLPFGTGGRRGPVGLGPNRINPWSVGSSVQGNVDFLRDRFGEDRELSVVIAADVRVFRDLRGCFPEGIDNPLLGMTSVDLAQAAAAIYVANGFSVYMLEPGSPRYVATPELSFLIRRLEAQGGLNISASHNHPDDNGGKFYTELGAQEVPPQDAVMVELVERVTAIKTMPWEDALATGRLHYLDPDLHEAYLASCSQVLRGRSRNARVVFSNLHGVGDQSVGEALEKAGFELHYVPSQRSHDGLFPNVRFRAPNPEYPSAFAEARVRAQELDADLILATDPDADRIGAMVPRKEPGAPFRFVTGNELSALVAFARFRGQPAGKVGIKTEVTTRLFSRVVRAAEGQVVEHLLVGCKYIAGVMRDLEVSGRSGEVVGGLEDVLIGTEESHGFLLTPQIRDKDAVAPALVLAELCAERKAEGSSLLEALEDLYRQHGAVANVQMPLVMAGSIGRRRILAIQEGLRKAPPRTIGGREVTAFHDRLDESGVFGPIVSETDRAARDVLAFDLGPNHRLVIRPSGTEPKTKIYAEAILEVGEDLDASLAGAQREAAQLATDFVRQALALVDLDMPAVGLHCSPLLGVDERIRFGRDLLPQAVQRAEAGQDGAMLRSWLAEELGAWGGDGFGLTAPGYTWWRSAEGAGRGVEALDEVWLG